LFFEFSVITHSKEGQPMKIAAVLIAAVFVVLAFWAYFTTGNFVKRVILVLAFVLAASGSLLCGFTHLGSNSLYAKAAKDMVTQVSSAAMHRRPRQTAKAETPAPAPAPAEQAPAAPVVKVDPNLGPEDLVGVSPPKAFVPPPAPTTILKNDQPPKPAVIPLVAQNAPAEAPKPAATPVVEKPKAEPVKIHQSKAKPVPKPHPAKAVAAKPVAHEESSIFKWEHFGADPFAKSKDEAMAKREKAFRALGLSNSCVAEAMRVTSAPGTAGILRNGDMLEASESGRAGVHHNVEIAFPRGVAATTIEWTMSCEGKTYQLILPEVCYNWSVTSTKAPLSVKIVTPSAKVETPQSGCVELSFDAYVGGEVRWGVGSANGALPPSECDAQKQGDGHFVAWWGLCDECEPALEFIRTLLGQEAQIYQKFLYRVTAKHQTLRFSSAILTRVVYICQEDASGAQSSGVYMRPQDWKGRQHVELSSELWKWDGDSEK
jgi:hypothetical protein